MKAINRLRLRLCPAVAVLLAVTSSVVAGAGVPAVADTVPAAGTPATVSADGLPTWQLDGVVWAQAISHDIVYVTGSFARARPPGVAVGGPGEVPAANIFAYRLSTGARVNTFNHRLNGQGRAITTSPDGSRVYIGGDFTIVDGAAHGHVAAFVTATGALDPAFVASVNGPVGAMAANAASLYLGGRFTAANNTARPGVAAVGAATGVLRAWHAIVDSGAVWSMVLAPDGSRLIVGGSFTQLNRVPAYGMGSLNSKTGAVLPWAATSVIKDATVTGAITSLRTDGRQIYGSGYAFGPGSSFEGTFAADPTTGAITLLNDCHGDTYDVVPVGEVLYSAGHPHDCRAIGSFPETKPRRIQRALAQTITPTTIDIGPDNYGWNFQGQPASTVLDWFPDLAGGTITGQGQAAWSIAAADGYVVMGGEFPTVNGVPQQGLVRFAVSTLAPNRIGPTYATIPVRAVPGPTAAQSGAPGSGRLAVTYGTAWDPDNQNLKYEVVRDGTKVVHTVTIATTFWNLPPHTYFDTLVPGTAHTYQIRITDPFGNVLLSPTSAPVTA